MYEFKCQTLAARLHAARPFGFGFNGISVADQGFSRGVPTQDLLFGKSFAKNCMKMKEFGPRGGAEGGRL